LSVLSVLFEDSEVHSRRLLATSPDLRQGRVHLDHFGRSAPGGPLGHPNQMMVNQNFQTSVHFFDPSEEMGLVCPETVSFRDLTALLVENPPDEAFGFCQDWV
jgi:hypothetical protein